jgi:hypothetical protein
VNIGDVAAMGDIAIKVGYVHQGHEHERQQR